MFPAASGPLAIPDSGAIDSGITVTNRGLVKTAAVTLDVSYPFDADLRLELVAPEGPSVILAEAVGMWGHDLSNTTFSDDAPASIVSALPPFAGRFRPLGPLDGLKGTAAQGTWKLRLSNTHAGYAGRLESWSLTLTSCGSVARPQDTAGAPTPPQLPTTVPTGRVAAQGKVITVTTASDAVNGDTTSVTHLEGAAGPDGISLREAIIATNNDPGTYTIRFASALAGATIRVGSVSGEPLPPLVGGHTLIDGDGDGDGRPDVTLDGQQIVNGSRCGICGLTISSNGNRLHALALQRFSTGVFFSAGGEVGTIPSQRTFNGNTITGLVITQTRDAGISLWPTTGHVECEATACATRNEWTDTRVIGNTIVSSRAGIEWILRASSGDALRRTTIAGNKITFGSGAFGINAYVGDGAGANGNRVEDTVIAYNSIQATASGRILTNAINVTDGARGGSTNTVQNLRLISNEVRFASGALKANGVEFVISDGCSVPGVLVTSGFCSTNNAISGVVILGNALIGPVAGVVLPDPCCGTSTQSTITDVRISGNVIDGSAPATELNPWGIAVAGPSTSKVVIDHNTITQQATDPATPHAATLAGGGIALVGGLGSDHKEIHDISVASNRIDTDLVGISVVGGGPSDEQAAGFTEGNRIADVKLENNVIGRTPELMLHWDAGVKGITVIAGLGGPVLATGQWRESRRNEVDGVMLSGNVVVGITNDVGVFRPRRERFAQCRTECEVGRAVGPRHLDAVPLYVTPRMPSRASSSGPTRP